MVFMLMPNFTGIFHYLHATLISSFCASIIRATSISWRGLIGYPMRLRHTMSHAIIWCLTVLSAGVSRCYISVPGHYSGRSHGTGHGPNVMNRTPTQPRLHLNDAGKRRGNHHNQLRDCHSTDPYIRRLPRVKLWSFIDTVCGGTSQQRIKVGRRMNVLG